MAKKPQAKPAAKGGVLNRRAKFDYELDESLVVGIELTGPEVRAARDGHIQLKGAFVTLRDDQLWLNNASFSVKLNDRSNSEGRTVDTRARRLLAHRKQIDDYSKSKQQGMTIVPLKLLTQGKFIKVVIAAGKGKKHYDKRETLKRRQQNRDTARQLSSRY